MKVCAPDVRFVVLNEGLLSGRKVCGPETVGEHPETVGGHPEAFGEAPEAKVCGPEAVGGRPETIGERPEGKVCGPETVGGHPEAAGGAWEALGGWKPLIING